MRLQLRGRPFLLLGTFGLACFLIAAIWPQKAGACNFCSPAKYIPSVVPVKLPSTQVKPFQPFDIAIDPTTFDTDNPAVYVTDNESHKVRRISLDGTVQEIAGDGTTCPDSKAPCGDGGRAVNAQLGSSANDGILTVAALKNGHVLIGDHGNHRIREVFPDPTSPKGERNIRTVIGNGHNASMATNLVNADLTKVSIGAPGGIVETEDGGFAFTDWNYIKTVSKDRKNINTVGDPSGGQLPGAQPIAASNVLIENGCSISKVESQNLLNLDIGYLVTDSGSNNVLGISPKPENTGVAGQQPDLLVLNLAGVPGTNGYNGDGGEATLAHLNHPTAAIAIPQGSVIVADRNNGALRVVGLDGKIKTIATDIDPVWRANTRLSPRLALASKLGSFFVTEPNTGRIRFFTADWTADHSDGGQFHGGQHVVSRPAAIVSPQSSTSSQRTTFSTSLGSLKVALQSNGTRSNRESLTLKFNSVRNQKVWIHLAPIDRAVRQLLLGRKGKRSTPARKRSNGALNRLVTKGFLVRIQRKKTKTIGLGALPAGKYEIHLVPHCSSKTCRKNSRPRTITLKVGSSTLTSGAANSIPSPVSSGTQSQSAHSGH